MKVEAGRDSMEVSPRIRRLRVLIVEDSSEDAVLLLDELERGGYEPESEVVDTPEAMRWALSQREQLWDVVLSAWQMPHFSASEALEMLRKAGSEAPFIIVSGKVGEEAAVEAMRAGAHDYVMKSNLTRLCATVERGLQEAQARSERERAEKSLKESEERYRRLVELSPDVIIVHGGGEVLFLNSAGAELFGAASPEELIGKPVMDFIHPDYREIVKARIVRTQERGEPTNLIQEKFLRLDGRAVDVEAVSMPIAYRGEAATLVVVRDITGRKRAEEERDRLFEVSLDLLGIASLDGYFKRVNPAFEETLGYSSGELLARPLIEFVHPEDRAATKNELESLGRGARTAYFENRYLRKDGSEVWLEWKAVPAVEEDLIYATARDVTERKRVEEALKRRDAILRAVAFAAERFLERLASWEESAQEVLERLGQAAEVSRVYVFENYSGEDGELWGTQRYEWVAAGVSSQMDNPLMQAIPYRVAGYGRWGELLSRGDLVHGHTREFSEEEQPPLREQDILSLVIVPIFVEGEWWGFIGFDECTSEREWSAAEIEALKAAADTLGAAIARVRAEEAIRQSEQLHRTVVEQATEYISLVDAETKYFVGSNPAFRQALGYTEKELEYMTLYDIVAHDRESIDQNAWQVLERGRYFLGERRHRRKDGSLVDVEVSASTVLHDGREVVCIVGHDVTERKRAEEEIRESQRALATLMSNLPGMVYRCCNDPDWTMEFVSAGCSELTGYPSEDLIGNRQKSYGDLIHPEDREAVWQRVQAALQERRPFQFNYRITTASGATKWVWEQGRGVFSPEGTLLALEGFIVDTTERMRARDALAQSEERYRTVVEQAMEGIFLCDAATGEVIESNTAFRKLLGYTAGELRGIKIHDLIDEDRESIDSNLQLILDEGSRFLGERRYRRKDGSMVDVEAAASVISYGGRKVICDVIRDVTERVEAFQMLEERVTALARMAASLTIDLPMEANLKNLATSVVRASTARACSMVLIEEETYKLRMAGVHGLPDGYAEALEESWQTGAHSFTVRAFDSQQPLLARDTRSQHLSDPLYASAHRFIREIPWDTVYIVPLVYRGRSLGAIIVYYMPDEEPEEDEIAFLNAIADQTAVAVENARLFAAAQGKAALEERQRLARELHDSVSQALYGIALGSRTARTLLDREAPPERVAEWLEYVLSLAEAGLTEMRALIFELRPESLETEGLVAALDQHAAAIRARHEIPVHATLGEEPDLPLETKEALYRIAQEALHNTVKHAHASSAELKLGCGVPGIVLEVSDDGAGFDPGGDFSGHLGLKSMRERATQLGGTLQVESAPGEGTSIRLRIPPGT